MKYRESCIRKELIYDGKILRLYRDEVELPNQKRSFRELVRHRGGVGVLPVKNREVYLVRQFRYPYEEELVEIPAGKREGEEPDESCGLRELAEETGILASQLIPLGNVYPSPGYTDERIAIFCAVDWKETKQQLDADEFVDVVKMPLKEAYEHAVSGDWRDAKTVIAVLRYVAKFGL